jgi:hypothetical protein
VWPVAERNHLHQFSNPLLKSCRNGRVIGWLFCTITPVLWAVTQHALAGCLWYWILTLNVNKTRLKWRHKPPPYLYTECMVKRHVQ